MHATLDSADSTSLPPEPSYRHSHASQGYADCYERTYSEGYYALQWKLIERPLVTNILASVAEAGATRSLDFACGTGRILEVHGEIFDDVVGNDISAEMIAVARQRCPATPIVEADLTAAGPPDEMKNRDVCTAFRFFLNAEPTLRSDALSVIRLCLAERGRLVANFHCNPQSPVGLIYRMRNRLAGRTINNLMSVEEARSLLTIHGFAIERVYMYGLWPRFGWRLNWLNKLLLARFERFGNRYPKLMRRAQSFIIVARCE